MRNWRRKRNNEEEPNSDAVVHRDENDSDSDSDSDSNESLSGSSSNDGNFVVTESEISYSIESFNAVATPVTITMVASAVAVVLINTKETREAGEALFANTYQILSVSDDQSAARNLGSSLINTLVLVSVICLMTFVVVLCYKYKCMKIFYSYMLLVTAGLLGFFTYQILMVAFSIYSVEVDTPTLTYILYNYAVVGTLSIFHPRGFPKWVPQGYLIAGSVCMAWQLSFFNAWMTWTLLVMLALYDLFAVLSPYGPLKALAKLISMEGAPALPGMIYEADLPRGVSRNGPPRASVQPPERGENQRATSGDNETRSNGTNAAESNQEETTTTTSSSTGRENSTLQQEQSRKPRSRRQINRSEQDGSIRCMRQENNDEENGSSSATGTPMLLAERSLDDISNKGKIPLVLARMYKLPVLDKKGVLRQTEQNANGSIAEGIPTEGDGTVRPRSIFYTEEEIQEIEWTPQQLSTIVTCIFPPRGGRIAKAKSREQKYSVGTAYIVYGRSGDQQRKFVVTPNGSVKEVLRRETSSRDVDDSNSNNDDGDEKGNTIKLGIGDFIFYSLLVSQAAKDSFTAFASCLLVVLQGLAATLLILAIKGKALPALPISVFLGVIAFLWTVKFLGPWIGGFVEQSIYV